MTNAPRLAPRADRFDVSWLATDRHALGPNRLMEPDMPIVPSGGLVIEF
jgi:hypothetical protein